MKRLFCSDFDNTIARKGKIPKENVEAVHRLNDHGMDFVLVSGRPAGNIRYLFKKYGIRGHIIANNGALCLPGGVGPAQGYPIPPEEAKALIDRAEREGWNYLFYSEEVCYFPTSWSRLLGSCIASGIVNLRTGMKVGSFSPRKPHFLEKGAFKMNIYVKKNLQGLIDEINSAGGLSATQSGDDKVEVMAGGVNKLLGIRTLARTLQVPMDRVVAIGDFDNDAEMLEGAGWSFAMSDGSDRAIQAAKMTTDPVDRMGFVKAVDWIIAHPEAGLLLA